MFTIASVLFVINWDNLKIKTGKRKHLLRSLFSVLQTIYFACAKKAA